MQITIWEIWAMLAQFLHRHNCSSSSSELKLHDSSTNHWLETGPPSQKERQHCGIQLLEFRAILPRKVENKSLCEHFYKFLSLSLPVSICLCLSVSVSVSVSVSLSLSYTHTHAHTHTHVSSCQCQSQERSPAVQKPNPRTAHVGRCCTASESLQTTFTVSEVDSKAHLCRAA